MFYCFAKLAILKKNLFVQNENVRWWPIYHGEQECVGKIQLFIGNTTTSDEDYHIKVCSFSNNPQIIYALFCEIMPILMSYAFVCYRVHLLWRH